VSEERDLSEVFRLLHDEYARQILTETSGASLSAKELADRCDASLSTIYRRAEALEAVGLLAERTELDEDGHHYTTYAATVGRVAITFEDGTMDVDITEDAADRLTRVWEGIRGFDG
jgi:DNA-binding IclR family transcriptional regulator